VVNTLSRQLTTASNSVESLGRRTRAMSRKLKGVETLSDQTTAESLLGFSADDFIEGGDEAGIVAKECALA
jgi:DNA recombination protein RmuC